MTTNGSVMKIMRYSAESSCIECATAQRAAAPLNKNESRISCNDFVTFRDTAFKPQNFWASRLAVN